MDTIAVYVHWPYCARICPYCDFNVYKQKDNPELLAAILDDLAGWRDWSGPRQVSSIHFGGGTPSLMPPQAISDIIEAVAALWSLCNTAEIAMEANPSGCDTNRWAAFRDAGISRLSLGVQSFQDRALRRLGRDHNGADADQALTLARDIFPSVSLDMIFGWSGQDRVLLDADLDRALVHRPDHISAYQLTIEPGTAFARAEGRGISQAVGPDQSAELYEHIRDRLIGAGYGHYEVSNYAKPGHESRHNLTYWRGGDYVGVGPGAHGRLSVMDKATETRHDKETRYATEAARQPQSYIQHVRETHLGVVEKTVLTPLERAEEYLFMGLRVSEGISLSSYEDLGGAPLSETALSDMEDAGLLQQKNDHIFATNSGRLVLNSIIERLLISEPRSV